MKHPLSIFSFDTLTGPWRSPKAAILALVLFASTEFVVRAQLATEHIATDPSLWSLAREHRLEIDERRPQVWLMGNSTLAYGIDVDSLRRETGQKLVAISHGTATARASSAMLAHYLRLSPKVPETVVLFVSKDDLNMSGSRAHASRRYHRFDSLFGWQLEDLLRTYAIRSRVRSELLLTLRNVLRGVTGREPVVPTGRTSHTNGKPATFEPKLAQLSRLSVNYSLDRGAIQTFVSVCRRHGVQRIAVWMVPVTRYYEEFHDKRNPNLSCEAITLEVENACRQHGVRFVSDAHFFSDLAHFRDPYHLNDAGRAEFTKRIIDRWRQAIKD